MSKIYHAGQLRSGRYSQESQIYLLTAVTHQRQPFFNDFRAGRLLVQQFRQVQLHSRANSLAWVVIPDHFHWLMELRHGDLSSVMLAVKSRGAREINTHLRRSGQIWQRGFHDRAIRRDEDMEAVARYIVTNPVRAGLVRRVHDYSLWDAIWVKDS